MLNCTSPIVINKRNYRNIQRYSFGNIVVGCGKCENCRRLKSLDFTIRAYYDYLWFTSDKYNNFKGFAMFDTLTYDEVHVPKKKLFGIEFKCFSSNDIKNFKGKLETSAVKRLLDIRKLSHNPKNRSSVRSEIRKCFKVLIVSEYGSQTHRPHYHILVFNKIREFTPKIIESLYMSAWTDKKNRMLGGVEDIPSSRKVIEGIGKFIYVSGYVNKDTEFYSEEVRNALNSLSIKEKNPFIPHNYFYRGFGIHLFDYYTESDLLEKGVKIKLPDGKNGFKYYNLPKYNLDKLIRDIEKIEDEDKTVYLRVLNKRGAEFYRNVFRQKHIKLESDYNSLLEKAKNYDYTDNSQITSVHRQDYSWYSVLNRKMEEAGINCYQLASYQMLYRGRYGAINPDTELPRPLRLDNVERRLRELYTNKYYSDKETIQKIYDSGIFFNQELEEIISSFEEFNNYLSCIMLESKEFLVDPKKRLQTKHKQHLRLKIK